MLLNINLSKKNSHNQGDRWSGLSAFGGSPAGPRKQSVGARIFGGRLVIGTTYVTFSLKS